MSDSPQPRRHLRRGGWIALLGIVVLISLMGGSYALGRSSDPAPATMSVQRASGTSSLPLMTWAQRHTDDESWMRNHADACVWEPPRSRARHWMRTDPNAARPGPRSDKGSAWSNSRHRDWMHDGWHDDYQRR